MAPPLSVLLIDDDAMVAGYLRRALTARGWTVRVVEDGLEALEVYEPDRFALVLSDVDLGGLPDGIALAQAIQSRSRDQSIILMSGDPDNEPRARAIGVSLLSKPFTVETLSELLALTASCADQRGAGR